MGEGGTSSVRDRAMHVARAIASAAAGVDVALIGFIGGLCLLVFGYGVAVQRYQLFPYGLIENAANAYHALKGLEDQSLMNGAEPSADAAPTPTVTTLSSAAGAERLLITGGPFQDLAHCPTHGCLAWLIDREGEVLHSWEVDLLALIDQMSGVAGNLDEGNFYPVGMALDDNGALYVTFHFRNAYPYQAGLAKIAPDGAVIWFSADFSHHWPRIGPDGLVYAPSMRLREQRERYDDTVISTYCEVEYYDEGVRVYDADGEVTREYWIVDALTRSGYRAPLSWSRDGCDVIHINSVDVATPEVAASQPFINVGDLLVSLRSSSVIALIDHETGLIKRFVYGQTVAQHAAHFLPDGRVIAFDNQGGDPALGGTRIVRIDLDTGELETIFPRSADQPLTPFFAEERGAINVSADGKRAIVASGLDGHVFELDLETGEPLWVLDQTFDITAFARMKHVNASSDNARFISYGGYYVDETPLLAASQ